MQQMEIKSIRPYQNYRKAVAQYDFAMGKVWENMQIIFISAQMVCIATKKQNTSTQKRLFSTEKSTKSTEKKFFSAEILQKSTEKQNSSIVKQIYFH